MVAELQLEIDKDGYPTDDSLKQISEYVGDFNYLLNSVSLFFEEFGRVEREDIENGVKWKVATGGWSGCESGIGALRRNFIFWGICWTISARGGYYEFEVKTK